MTTGQNFLNYFKILVILVVYVKICVAQQFDQEFTGVYFTPYVKFPYRKGGTRPLPSNYTTKEIRVMLEVILGKFSKAALWGAGSDSGSTVHYKRNDTYYNGAYPEVKISEIAASINRDQDERSITIFQGIRVYDGLQMDTEVHLAIECAQKANKIYPGTVVGLAFSYAVNANSYTPSEQTLKYLKYIRALQNLKIGTRMKCNDYSSNNVDQKGVQLLRDILQESDFVICDIKPANTLKMKGPVVTFSEVSKFLLSFQNYLRESSIGLEVMAHIEWISEGDHEWDNLENMATYWQVASQWAHNQNFMVWFHEAFDIPSDSGRDSYFGWWRLTENSKSDQREGYIEKVSDTKNPTNNRTTTASINESKTIIVVASVVIGLAILIVFSSIIAFLLLRVRKLQQKLSKVDIQQFMEGMPREVAAQQQSEHNLDTSALRVPYKKSYEIPKNRLKIQRDQILGMGQFGCVFKAVIESLSDESKHVALKVARDDCPGNALKGLLSEIKILIYIDKHPNIVALMGAYTAELQKGIVYIATELCNLGSLQDYLRRKGQTYDSVDAGPSNKDDLEHIGLQQMLQWSLEIACGMEYLGTKNVVHADLATRNVLLTVDKTAKITDFGLSRRMYDYTNYVKTEQEPLPWRWMSIESLKRCEFSVKSDVWSYGITLWEIFTMGDIPYFGLTWTTGFVNMLENGLRLESPTNATPELYKLMGDCWQKEINKRHGFTCIKQLIENYITQCKTSPT